MPLESGRGKERNRRRIRLRFCEDFGEAQFFRWRVITGDKAKGRNRAEAERPQKGGPENKERSPVREVLIRRTNLNAKTPT